MTAVFLDENLPDGTRLRPPTKFIKYWKMRNTGTASWNADTKVRRGTPPPAVQIISAQIAGIARWSIHAVALKEPWSPLLQVGFKHYVVLKKGFGLSVLGKRRGRVIPRVTTPTSI